MTALVPPFLPVPEKVWCSPVLYAWFAALWRGPWETHGHRHSALEESQMVAWPSLMHHTFNDEREASRADYLFGRALFHVASAFDGLEGSASGLLREDCDHLRRVLTGEVSDATLRAHEMLAHGTGRAEVARVLGLLATAREGRPKRKAHYSAEAIVMVCEYLHECHVEGHTQAILRAAGADLVTAIKLG